MVHMRKPGVHRDMEARRAYRRAWMAARRARASTKSGEAAARKKEPVAAHPQKSNRAIAAETGVAFKTVARAASGGPNDTPEKTIGLDYGSINATSSPRRLSMSSSASCEAIHDLTSMSQKIGTNPAHSAACAVAAKVNEGMIA